MIRSKIDFWGSLGGWHPQTMSKYLFVKYLLLDFWGPILGGFPVELPQKISGEKIAFAAQQLYTKIRFRCVVGLEEERTKIRKKKKERKRKRKEKNKK